MVSPQSKPKPAPDPPSSPARISFSSDFLDDNDFISICPNRHEDQKHASRNIDNFEFLSGDHLTTIVTADELFSDGKLLPFWQSDTLTNIAMKKTTQTADHDVGTTDDEERRISWFLDDDPSPRPPTCTVLWKELLRLKKQRRPSTLSPSSSSSSSSSSESLSVGERKKGGEEREKSRVKKVLERTRSATVRIRPMINVPICTPARNPSLPPLFPIRRRKSES